MLEYSEPRNDNEYWLEVRYRDSHFFEVRVGEEKNQAYLLNLKNSSTPEKFILPTFPSNICIKALGYCELLSGSIYQKCSKK